MKDKLFAALSILIGFAAAFAFGEVVFRLLPVNDGLMAMPVNAASPVFHFTPNRKVTWSRDWDFAIVNPIRVNNAGYVNDLNYDAADRRPLLAVVGDSFVEASMVPTRDTLHARLAAAVAPGARVYSLAASGAPLSQYLVWAREARERWKAQALVIVVVGNDFDESLAIYKTGPGFHHYVPGPDGTLRLQRVDYQPSTVRVIARKSAFVRYLLFNLQAHERLAELAVEMINLVKPAHAEQYVGNTSAATDAERIRWSEAAVRAFFRDLADYAGWRPGEVLFLLDGIRYPSDSPAVAASYFARMRTFFMEEARRLGFEAIDMDPAFFAHGRATGERFEYPTDSHWNSTAHGLAAAAAQRSGVFSRWRRSTGQAPPD
jgi:hypothetical protein